MIGLKVGTIDLHAHNDAWCAEAKMTIDALKNIFGDVCRRIEHIGSTSVKGIKAKPIIDLACEVTSFDTIKHFQPHLEALGYTLRENVSLPNALYFIRRIENNQVTTHHLHVFKEHTQEFKNHLYFRDALRDDVHKARAYEDLKVYLMNTHKGDRPAYTQNKEAFIKHTIRKAQVAHFLGQTVEMKVDRPIGTPHPKHPHIIYPINYGYIEGEIAPDGEELDVYLLGVNQTVEAYTGVIVAIVHRENDVEDKLVMAPRGVSFSEKEIKEITHFQEQYYTSIVEVLKPSS